MIGEGTFFEEQAQLKNKNEMKNPLQFQKKLKKHSPMHSKN